jgi:hypothetical protein
VIHPFGQHLVKAAGRTPLGKTVKAHRFRLNTGNKEKHDLFFNWSTGIAKKTHHFNTPILPVHRVIRVELKNSNDARSNKKPRLSPPIYPSQDAISSIK